VPMTLSRAERWQGALCPNEDPEIFFPLPGRPPKNPVYREICAKCSVQNFCLEYGIVHEEEGVWGGQSKSERDSLSPFLRAHLVQKAKREGWYEERPSVDDLLSVLSPSESHPQSYPEVPSPYLLEAEEDQSSVFSFDLSPQRPPADADLSVFAFDIA
jgi:hypothetical protein